MLRMCKRKSRKSRKFQRDTDTYKTSKNSDRRGCTYILQSNLKLPKVLIFKKEDFNKFSRYITFSSKKFTNENSR